MTSRDYNLKAFLDETAINLTTFTRLECRDLFDQLVNLILNNDTDADLCEEVLSFCAASVIEMIKSSTDFVEKLLNFHLILRRFANFHVFVSAVTSTVITSERMEVNVAVLLEAIISGLSAIESQTISLSGSSLVKLLKMDPRGVSRLLYSHADFVPILIADMCAMFSRLEEEHVQIDPFVRIVRFCELIIDLSGDAELKCKIVKTAELEFINKIYRSKMKEMLHDRSDAVKWSNELLKKCHRGDVLVQLIINEAFRGLDGFKMVKNKDFKEILGNERCRPIQEVVNLLFKPVEGNEERTLKITSNQSMNVSVDDSLYREALKRLLNSFESFPVNFEKGMGNVCLTKFAIDTFKNERDILINWLPYCLQVVEVEAEDVEMRMYIDISGRINEFLL